MNIYIDKRRTGFSCPHIQEKENDRTIVHVVEWEIGSKVVKNTKYSERKYFFFQHFFWKGDLQNETIANREKDWHFHNHNLDLLAKGWHPCQDAHCLCSHCTRWDQPPILTNTCAKKVFWLLPSCWSADVSHPRLSTALSLLSNTSIFIETHTASTAYRNAKNLIASDTEEQFLFISGNGGELWHWNVNSASPACDHCVYILTLHVLIIYGAYLSLVAILRFYLHLVIIWSANKRPHNQRAENSPFIDLRVRSCSPGSKLFGKQLDVLASWLNSGVGWGKKWSYICML